MRTRRVGNELQWSAGPWHAAAIGEGNDPLVVRVVQIVIIPERNDRYLAEGGRYAGLAGRGVSQLLLRPRVAWILMLAWRICCAAAAADERQPGDQDEPL